MKIILAILFSGLISSPLLASTNTFGNWKVTIKKDKFTEEVLAYASTKVLKYNSESLQLQCNAGTVLIGFRVIDDVFALPDSLVKVDVKIDKNKAFTDMNGRMFLGSYNTGYLLPLKTDKIEKIIEQMKAGNYAEIRVTNETRGDWSVARSSLVGFTKAYDAVKGVCK